MHFIFSIGGILTGLFVGPHVLIPGIICCAVGVCGFKLAGRLRSRTRHARRWTFVWCAVVLAALFTLGLESRGEADAIVVFVIGGFLGMLTLLILPALLQSSATKWLQPN